jgi:hypothetical protein
MTSPSNGIISIRDDKWSLDESIDTKLHELNGTLLVNGRQQNNVLYTITGRQSAGTYIKYYVTPSPSSTGFSTNGSRSITTTYDSTTTTNSVDTGTVGTYTITYNVTDSSGNTADQKTRTVNVGDSTAPVITLVGSTPVTVEVGSTYTDSGATATDSFDGNLTSSIVTVSSVDTSTVGTYTVTYNVTDANGNKATEVTRTVNVVDTTVPVITLLGETPVTVEVGSTYTDAGASASDNYDGDLTGSIVTVSSVDTSTVGK